MKEMMNLFSLILKNKDIIIGNKGLFDKDTLTIIKAIFRGKIPDNYKLTEEQKLLVKNAFISTKKTFNQNTPLMILEDNECIKSSLSRDINSINYLRNIDSNLHEYIINASIQQELILNNCSHYFLRSNFLIALNSIKLNYTTADFVNWGEMNNSETEILINEVLGSKYTLSDKSPIILKQNISVVLNSIQKDKESIKYISETLKDDPEIFKYLIKANYNFESEYIMSRTLNYFIDPKVFEISLNKINKHITDDKKYIERFNKLYSDAINTKPTLKTFDSIFQNLAEIQWNEYRKKNFRKYDNIFGKICAELRNESSFINAIDNLDFLYVMQSILEDKYDILYIAMREYFDIYHSDENNKIQKLESSKNIISKFSALYVAKSKEIHKKETLKYCYEIIKNYFTLNIENLYVNKKVIQFQNKEKFKRMYQNRDKNVCEFINELIKKYSKYIDSEFIEYTINDFILYNIYEYDENLYAPDYYLSYCKYEKVIKLINRLNNGYIKYDSIEVFKYRNLISFNEKIGVYIYNGKVFSDSELQEIDEYRKKEKIFNNIKKEIIFKIHSMDFDNTIDNSILLDEMADELPFNDDYFTFNIKYVLEKFNLRDLIKSSMRENGDFSLNSFNLDESYNNIYNLLVNNGMIWLLLLTKNKCDYRLMESGIKRSEIIKIINNMENITQLSKEFKLDINKFKELLIVQKISKYADRAALAILGKDVIEKLCKSKEYAYDKEPKIINMAKELVCQMTKRSKSTIPYINGQNMNYNYSIYDSQDETILISGIDTDACFKISGNDNDFLHYCALDKNGFVIKITDCFGNFIARASGFRNGNCVFINQLRTIYDEGGDCYRGKYINERDDIINTFKKACEEFISVSQNNVNEKCKIDFVFVTKSYCMENYESNVSDEVEQKIGENPMDTESDDWKQFINNVNNLEESYEGSFATDYGDYSLICIASSNKIENINAEDINKMDVPAVYERKRNNIIVTASINSSIYQKINKTKAIKSFFENTDFKVIDIPEHSITIVGDNWYIIYNNGNIIDSCLLDFDDKAKTEFEQINKELLKYNNDNLSNSELLIKKLNYVKNR